MTSKRRQARRLRVWRRYDQRLCLLVEGPVFTADGLFAMRVNQGYFRAEGLNTRNPRSSLRHGA